MRRDDDADEVPYSHSHRAVPSSKAIGDFSILPFGAPLIGSDHELRQLCSCCCMLTGRTFVPPCQPDSRLLFLLQLQYSLLRLALPLALPTLSSRLMSGWNLEVTGDAGRGQCKLWLRRQAMPVQASSLPSSSSLPPLVPGVLSSICLTA